MPVAILRHGKAKYEVLKIDNLPSTFFDANSFLQATKNIRDLDEQNIVDLQTSIEHWIEQYPGLGEKKIVVWVSPFARTLETASYLVQGLQNHNIKIKNLSVVDSIKEVEGFSWAIFDALVSGGTITVGDNEIKLDKLKTNPENLSHTDYFFAGFYKKIDEHYLCDIGLNQSISAMETYEDVTARSKKVLQRVMNAIDNDTVLCIVTHQAFSDWITKEKVGQYEGQKPGEIFYLTDSTIQDGTIERIT